MSKPELNPAQTLYGALCGALALELSSTADAAHALPREKAGALAQLCARDLAGIEPRVSALSMSIVGAHYDPIELLRPGWPLHTELDQLSARAPGQGRAQVVAFGADQTGLPGHLTPAHEYLGGPLRVVPFVLRGEMVAEVSARLERDLIEHGMANAGTALLAQENFQLKIEHARYLTVHDLCAMMALHYEHAGLAPLWPLIETALLSPEREICLDAPPEPFVRWRGGRIEMARLSEEEWTTRYAPHLDSAQSQHLRGYVDARQRQFSSVLKAHALEVRELSFRDR